MTADEFSLKLQERLHSLDFWVQGLDQSDLDKIADDFGTPRKTPEEIRDFPIEVLDVSLIDGIAYYLVAEEELNPNDEDTELEFMLRVGNFIYGWEQWKATLLRDD